MAAFTSKATGNWSASGQTTWNEPGVPGLGDRVTINSPHVVTADVDTKMGDGSDVALVISLGATLAIPSGIAFGYFWGMDNQGVLDQADGAIFYGIPQQPVLSLQWYGVEVR